MRTRPTARTLVVDEHQRILLVKYEDKVPVHFNRPDLRVYWVTPGGGVEVGETYAQAALRELWEETGIKDVPLGPCLWQSERVLVPPDSEALLLTEHFFLVRVANNAINLDNLLEYESEIYRDYRWWALSEIRQSKEMFIPEGFANLVAPFLQ